VPADLPAASEVYRSASLSNAGDRDNLLAHPDYLVLRPEGLAEGRTYVAEEQGSLVGFATWLETALDHTAAANPNPGRVAVHRLNQVEYTNAVRDLLGLELGRPPHDRQHGIQQQRGGRRDHEPEQR